jgi:hypothetical protein
VSTTGRASQQRLELSTGSAVFDSPRPDARYRYLLGRTWGRERPAVFVMLNPSTATTTEDDPTVRRCIGYARAWNCGGLVVANIFALRSTDPDQLLIVGDPVGPDNDRHIWDAVLSGSPVVCAWGSHKAIRKYNRDHAILDIFRTAGVQPLCLRQTEGRPHHPLYLPAALRPVPLEEVA